MLVHVRMFAQLKQITGGDRDEAFEGDGVTLDALQARLCDTFPALAGHLGSVAFAVNREYVSGPMHELRDGDEVALIPPISGGASESPGAIERYVVTESVLDAAALRGAVLTPSSGALLVFEGVVRDRHEGHAVLRLEYEAFAEMAVDVLRQVGEAIEREFEIHGIAIHHRVGTLEVGETSLLVLVSAEHRAEAFAAGQRAVDRVKESVPVWKREHGPDGATWQEGAPARPVD
jgi:molybdopterin synthase catalytic subunit/molybdopterin converting factor small subunit